MKAKNNEKARKTGKPTDTDASLQSELSREAPEGSDSIGDVASNRNLTGSSSWETLPDKSEATSSAPKTAKGSSPSKAAARGQKKSR